MLRTSRKTLLAIEAVVDIALHARPDPVQSRDLRSTRPQRRVYPRPRTATYHGQRNRPYRGCSGTQGRNPSRLCAQ